MKVSVIVPSFNSEKTIDKAIVSVLNQSLKEFELIIIDDHSADSSLKIIESYKDDRISIIKNNKNYGPSYCRNLGFKKATGKYISLLDSDDWFDSDRLEKLFNLGEFTKSEIVTDFNMVHFQNNISFHPQKLWFLGEYDCVSIVNFIDYDFGSIQPLLKRDFLIKNNLFFNEDSRYGEDFELFFKFLLSGGKMVIHNSPMYHRLLRNDSLSKNLEIGFRSSKLIINEFLSREEIITKREIREAFVKRYQNLHKNELIYLLKKKNFLGFLKKLIKHPKLNLFLIKKMFEKITSFSEME